MTFMGKPRRRTSDLMRTFNTTAHTLNGPALERCLSRMQVRQGMEVVDAGVGPP